jgi:pimeloyl-ACP methyl ester carboxylesterase
MDALIHRVSAWDRLPLIAREWRNGGILPPLLCLPGVVRTGEDFESLASVLPSAGRIVSVDYLGRGDSGRAHDVKRYVPEACLRDILDVCAALHLNDVIVIGTSFGGLLSMGLAVARPSLMRAVVLNDVGPEIGAEAADFVRDFVARDPAFPSLDASVRWLRENLPPLSLHTDAAWRRMAELTYEPGPDGRWHPRWDTRIATLLERPVPDLWPLFGALTHLPLLLVRGERSDILLPDTVARMRAVRPDMEIAILPGIGHAPILTEPPIAAALLAFLERVKRPNAP